MNIRINAGYIITDSIHVGETEFVLGVHSTAPSQFVTWACKNGTDYFWGALLLRFDVRHERLAWAGQSGVGVLYEEKGKHAEGQGEIR